MLFKAVIVLCVALFSASALSAQVYFNPANPEKQIYSISINSQRALEAKSVRAACRNGFRLLGPGRRNPSIYEIVETPRYDASGVQTDLDFTCTIRYEFFSASNIRYIDYSGKALCSSGGNWVPALCDGDYTSIWASMCVGNPVSIGDGRKYEHATDWRSEIDPRFTFDRLYTSDHARVPDLSAFGYGQGWSSPWGKKIVEINPSRYVYHAPQGTRRAFIGLGAVVPETDGHPHTMEASSAQYGGRHAIHDGTGKVELFAQSTNAIAYLDEIIWPDGYAISFEYDVDGRLSAMADNKDQRAEFSWDLTLNPNTIVPVISSVAIDVDYDGTAISPEVQIDYTHYKTTFWHDRLMLRRAKVTELQNSTVLSNFRYRYWTNSFMLAYIYDGRLNTDGEEVEFATFRYGTIGSSGGMIPISTEHFGGVDKYASSNTITTGSSDPDMQVTVTNPLGKETRYDFEWSANKRVPTTIDGVATPDCLGTAQSFGYTPNPGAPEGYVYERVERNGARTVYTRDAHGLVLTKTEDADGTAPRVTSYTWHSSLRLPLTRTTSQMEETFTYDPDGLLTSYSQRDVLAGSPSLNAVRTTTYNYTPLASGVKVLTSVDGPGLIANGVDDVTTYTYNSDATIASSTDPNGLVTLYESYDVFGNATRVVQPDGTAWSLTYDAEGQLLEAVENTDLGSQNKTTFTYDIIGQMTSMTDGLNQTWTYTYDEARRLVEIENPAGDTVNYTHDLAGNITKTEYAGSGGPVTFFEDVAFDELSRIKTVLGAEGQTTAFTYDEEDNLKTVVDALSFVTTNGYDALNRVSETIDRASGTTLMDHDDADQMTDYTDPRGLDTTFTYNGFGEVVQEVSADRGTMNYTYNDRGLVTSMTDARSIVSNYAYDDGGRLTSRTFPSATGEDQTFTYDTTTNGSTGEGKIGLISDESGSITREYGSDGYIALDRRMIEAAQYDVQYGHDTYGRLNKITYPGALEVVYTFDALDRVTGITAQRLVIDPGTGQLPLPETIVDQITYKPSGPLASMTYGDGATHTRTYDSSYRLTGLLDEVGLATLRDIAHSYTSRDNLSTITDGLNALNSEIYQYSAREFLSQAAGLYDQIEYTYDAVGNRATRAVTANATTVTDIYAYPLTSNRLDTITQGAGGTRTLTYDAAGNVTYDNQNGGGYGYTYNAAGRMESFSINGVVQAEYLYNAMGQQAVRHLTQAGQTIHSVHDLDGNRLAEYDYDPQTGTATLLQEYIWLDGAPVAVVDGATGAIAFIRTDHIARPVFATDDVGVKVWEASYLPFGGVQTATGSNPDLRFPGQWFQSESGLHQNWMREYDPTTGRYIQADPLGLVDGASVYGYALQNPSRYTDPRGEACREVGKDKFGAIRLNCDSKPYCPSGDCRSRSSHDNDPEYAQCVQQCRKITEYHKSNIAACASIAGLAPKQIGAPLAAVCAGVTTRIECSEVCDREEGYCKQMDDNGWTEFPHQLTTPQSRQSTPVPPGVYR